MEGLPTISAMAIAHIHEIQRLARAMAIEQLQLSRMLCGRRVRPKGKVGPVYQIAMVTFSSAGSPLIHGHLVNRKKKEQLGDLSAVDFI